MKEVVEPFYEEQLPDMYDANLQLDVRFRDGVSKEEQRIKSHFESGIIEYDILGEIDITKSFSSEKISFEEVFAPVFVSKTCFINLI